MKQMLHRLSRRTLMPILGLALVMGAESFAAPAVHAEPKAPTDHMTVPCRDGTRWYGDGEVVSIRDEEDGITEYYQCRDGEWVEIMGTKRLPGGATLPRTVVPVGVLSAR